MIKIVCRKEFVEILKNSLKPHNLMSDNVNCSTGTPIAENSVEENYSPLYNNRYLIEYTDNNIIDIIIE